MLCYLDKFVYISDDSSTPESIVQKNNRLYLTFKNLSGICMNGITRELDNSLNNKVKVELYRTRATETQSSCSMIITIGDYEKKYTGFASSIQNKDAPYFSKTSYTFIAVSVTLYYIKDINWLDITTNEGYSDRYQLQYNNMGMCMLNNAADLKWFLKDYPDTKPAFLINKYGQVCLSYIYDLDTCLNNIYKSMYEDDNEIAAMDKLSETETAYVTTDGALVPIGNNIGTILEAYSYIVMTYHIRYNPIIFNNKKFHIGYTDLENTFKTMASMYIEKELL